MEVFKFWFSLIDVLIGWNWCGFNLIWKERIGLVSLLFHWNLCSDSVCIFVFINQRSMNLIVEQSAWLQSVIDLLEGWAFCQFSLVVSVLSPLCASHLALSLSLADAGARWFKLMTVLSAVIEMYWSQVLWVIYTTAWIHTVKIQPGALSPTCMWNITRHSHTQLLPLTGYKEQVCAEKRATRWPCG